MFLPSCSAAAFLFLSVFPIFPFSHFPISYHVPRVPQRPAPIATLVVYIRKNPGLSQSDLHFSDPCDWWKARDGRRKMQRGCEWSRGVTLNLVPPAFRDCYLPYLPTPVLYLHRSRTRLVELPLESDSFFTPGTLFYSIFSPLPFTVLPHVLFSNCLLCGSRSYSCTCSIQRSMYGLAYSILLSSTRLDSTRGEQISDLRISVCRV